MGASKYAWQYVEELASKSVNIALVEGYADAYEKYYPQGELVYVDDYSTNEVDLSLAYKFNIYAAEPLSRGYVYVDASNGKVLLNDAIIKHAEGKTFATTENLVQGSGDTRYAGNRSFDTTLNGAVYELNGIAINGIENETRSMDGIGGIPLSVPALYSASVAIEDNDNNWTQAEHMPDDFSLPYPVHNEFRNDDVALDAHWGAEVVLQYWFEKHNRSSYDGLGTKVFNFVHYGDAYDNAFWNGEAMTYGDGSAQQGVGGGFLPLTSMDVCAHEIGHGVCEFTSNLVYQRESGAMNEGFSDIWAAAVEYYVLTEIDGSLPYQPFGIGEQIDNGDGGVEPGQADTEALRWMDDPKAAGDPDSYGGDNWIEPECGEPTLANDYCGVHTNSGVLNKWYYLLVMGSGQTFSPGSGKAATDDEISDGGRAYSVTGIGYEMADQIAFMGETLLTPNATFDDMRQASILAAETLYSINEVEQVTNAWFAVDIGDEFDPGTPDRIYFNSGNPLFTTENTTEEGCDASKIVTMGITAIDLPSSQTITLDVTGNANEGQDFTLSQTEFTFPTGSSNATLDITIFNDGVIEEVENIGLSFTYNGELNEQNLDITDNDIVPVIGNEVVELLATETFDTSDMPENWSENTVDELSPSLWNFNGNSQAAGRAYISNGTGEPTYDINVASNTILQSPTINALGYKNVQVTFDWEAGGEQDVVTGDYFDYGEFVYSTDGVNFVSVEQYTGTAGGNIIASGTFDMVMPELTNTQFVLGWRWFNDTLVGSAYSFSIDNVTISATPGFVETQLDASDENRVQANRPVYFVSSQNGDVMAYITNTSADELGCVELVVREAGSADTVEMSDINATRASKVIELIADGPQAENASYLVTLYFTNDEVSNFTDVNELRILKVDDSDINAASDSAENYAVGGFLEEDNSASGYYTFIGSFVGPGTLTVAEGDNIVLGTDDVATNEIAIYPSPATSGELVTIKGNTPIDEIAIYDVRGVLVSNLDYNQETEVRFNTDVLSSGYYFVVVNKDRAKTLRFIVK